MTTDAYFDMRNLASPLGEPSGCPVSGCAAPLADCNWRKRKMPYCSVHRIRIHAKARTFVYSNGPDETSMPDPALRNILFEPCYFKTHILGNAAKAESHRICHENSEDALTWNVFSRLARGGMLAALLSTFTTLSLKDEPELYLWGLKICLDGSSKPTVFKDLKSARDFFEEDIRKFKTEPDIMLYVPGQLLVLVEAKFTSGNTNALKSATDNVAGEKPKSRKGILERYELPPHLRDTLHAQLSSGRFYSQLYRNLVFAIYMADKLGVKWSFVNLVSKRQFDRQKNKVEFQDPTQFIRELLPEKSSGQFLFYNWEQLYKDHVAKATDLKDLAEYMCNKSANCVKALDI